MINRFVIEMTTNTILIKSNDLGEKNVKINKLIFKASKALITLSMFNF